MRHDTETHCHCGAEYAGSDHCPECGCEQYESGDCGHDHRPTVEVTVTLTLEADTRPEAKRVVALWLTGMPHLADYTFNS